MTYIWLTGVISAFYIFDSAMIQFVSDALHIRFLTLTLIYLGSVAEVNLLFVAVKRWINRIRARAI